MEGHRGRAREADVEGVFFELSELEVLRGLDCPGVGVEIVVTAPSYQEVVVFRAAGSPSAVLGTLHKSPDGLFMLTREDTDLSLVAPGVRRAYLSLEDVLSGLEWVLGRRPARSG